MNKTNQPVIPEETMIEMKKFFMKTSVPRILASQKKEQSLK
ncbi:hypothetical protein [Bacillus sp. ISL-57]|nr:hypothetical protein [Bacillus sp. ISL-57]